MLKAITSFFESNIEVDNDKSDREHRFKLATAALLIEVSRMDDHYHEKEANALQLTLQNRFQLSKQETEELISLASQELNDSVDYFQFTALINSHFEYEDKVHLVELMWQIAYADNELDKDEEYLVRKVSELLYVSHTDFIRLKLAVRDKKI